MPIGQDARHPDSRGSSLGHRPGLAPWGWHHRGQWPASPSASPRPGSSPWSRSSSLDTSLIEIILCVCGARIPSGVPAHVHVSQTIIKRFLYINLFTSFLWYIISTAASFDHLLVSKWVWPARWCLAQTTRNPWPGWCCRQHTGPSWQWLCHHRYLQKCPHLANSLDCLQTRGGSGPVHSLIRRKVNRWTLILNSYGVGGQCDFSDSPG